MGAPTQKGAYPIICILSDSGHHYFTTKQAHCVPFMRANVGLYWRDEDVTTIEKDLACSLFCRQSNFVADLYLSIQSKKHYNKNQKMSMGDDDACPICLNDFTRADLIHPLQCHCGYNFCSSCIHHLIQSSRDDYQVASDGSRHVKVHLFCPNCRSSLQSSIRDTLLLRWADMTGVVPVKNSDNSSWGVATDTRTTTLLSASLLQIQQHLLSIPQIGSIVRRAQKREANFRFFESKLLEDEEDDEEECGIEVDWTGKIESNMMALRPFMTKQEHQQYNSYDENAKTNIKMDVTLLGGLHYFLSRDECVFLTECLTSGQPNRLAKAAQVLSTLYDMIMKRAAATNKTTRPTFYNNSETTPNNPTLEQIAANDPNNHTIRDLTSPRHDYILQVAMEAQTIHKDKKKKKKRDNTTIRQVRSTSSGRPQQQERHADTRGRGAVLAYKEQRQQEQNDDESIIMAGTPDSFALCRVILKAHPLPARMPKYMTFTIRTGSKKHQHQFGFTRDVASLLPFVMMESTWNDNLLIDAYGKITIHKGKITSERATRKEILHQRQQQRHEQQKRRRHSTNAMVNHYNQLGYLDPATAIAKSCLPKRHERRHSASSNFYNQFGYLDPAAAEAAAEAKSCIPTNLFRNIKHSNNNQQEEDQQQKQTQQERESNGLRVMIQHVSSPKLIQQGLRKGHVVTHVQQVNVLGWSIVEILKLMQQEIKGRKKGSNGVEIALVVNADWAIAQALQDRASHME